ncbi:MAG: tRNA lysidine(34) synthetase TilS [Solirubrobacteraceae bacterium]
MSPDELVARIRRGGLLARGAPVLVMLSGGQDSTCLLELAARIAGPSAVSALHVNYRLRPGADGDERHCRELCRRLDVALQVRRPRRRENGNLQAWARDVRYGAAAQLALGRGADVAAGHTATDQVETILYRLASSPSRRALLGMAPRDGRLIRPLLGIDRRDTATYCRQRGLGWREDEGNASRIFARAKIRGELVPALARIHPGAQQNVLALAEILRDEAAVLDELVDRMLEGAQEITLAHLGELPGALARLVVQRLADDVVGGPAPGVARRTADVLALAGRGTAALDLPNGVRALVEHGVLRFGCTPPMATNRRSGHANADREAKGELADARSGGYVGRPESPGGRAVGAPLQ